MLAENLVDFVPLLRIFSNAARLRSVSGEESESGELAARVGFCPV